MVVFSCGPFPNILSQTFYMDHWWNLPTTLKKRLLQTLIEEITWSVRKFVSQFFRTTTGILSGPNVFDKSKFVMTFLTILGVTEIPCSFRLVLEGKTGKEIPKSESSHKELLTNAYITLSRSRSSLFQEQILMFCSINVMSLSQNASIEINLLSSVLKIDEIIYTI